MEIDHGLNAQTLMLDEWLQNVTLAIRFPSHTPDFPIPSLYWWSPFKASISHFEAILHVTGASYSPSYLAPRTVKSLGCQLMDLFLDHPSELWVHFQAHPFGWFVSCQTRLRNEKDWKILKRHVARLLISLPDEPMLKPRSPECSVRVSSAQRSIKRVSSIVLAAVRSAM